MKIKAKDAECRAGMEAVELALIASGKEHKADLKTVSSSGIGIQLASSRSFGTAPGSGSRPPLAARARFAAAR